MRKFDVIVIGGGHAGTEAAAAAAKMGCSTALITLNASRIGFMSCNPAMGGLAKGQLIKEIDALGGIMGRLTDRTAIQYRRLNSSKGPAVRSSRAQCDKPLYAQTMQSYLSTHPNLTILETEVADILSDGKKIEGVLCRDGSEIHATSVIVTAGTFMRAVMHTGFEQTEGGRAGDQAAVGLSQSISKLGFQLGRLKTGTPPRLHKDSINYSEVEPQPGDEKPVPFSFYELPNPFPYLPQVNCYITYTNEQTHEIIEENFDRSPMFTGVIQGVGPRYCPSIEDKVKRFRDKNRHQIFLEPEGLNVDEIYVNGVSTSLPKDVQERFIRSIPGLSKAEFIRFGYAVEYDAIDPRMLKATLESKDVDGLFFAGQVNGTSGYEEAGAQGLIAGINAARKSKQLPEFTLGREDAYIGVMIDDLILKGVDEPYRMFTSRAEYRLLLREDNADARLGGKGFALGLLSENDHRFLQTKLEAIEMGKKSLEEFFVYPTAETQKWFSNRGLPEPKDRLTGTSLLKRPEISWSELSELGFSSNVVPSSVHEELEIQLKYEGYIKRDIELLEGVKKSDGLRIPSSMQFSDVPGLSTEIRQRLDHARPETIGQASRLPGVTPAAVANLLIYLKMSEKSHERTVRAP